MQYRFAVIYETRKGPRKLNMIRICITALKGLFTDLKRGVYGSVFSSGIRFTFSVFSFIRSLRPLRLILQCHGTMFSVHLVVVVGAELGQAE